jgi:gamma-glutamyltranspeptidase / glutathione hydrolase
MAPRPLVPVLFAAAAVLCAAGRANPQARPDVQGPTAAVVADHPLAAAAGAEVLRRGGNAVDAAVTMAAVLAVVRPHMNGVGGDAFMLIREERSGRIHALNGSGRSAAAATPAAFRVRGYTEMPARGLDAVTVPGAVQAWSDALRRHGTLTLAQALAPAIAYAAAGFPVSERLAADIAASRDRLAADRYMAAVFLPDGNPPQPGTLLRQPDLARTLQLLAQHGAEVLYTGELAARIDELMAGGNGLLSLADLARHSSTWQQPITTTYAGYRIVGFPPNTQGVALLMQMNMAGLFDQAALGHNEPEYIHTLVEITKLAFAERDRHVTDPAFVDIPLERMLSPERALELVAAWGAGTPRVAPDTTASSDTVGPAAGGAGAGCDHGDGRALHDGAAGCRGDDSGDTVFLGVVDAHGNAVALIQSLYSAFGSGRMVPGTGIVLHNRGALFSLDSTHVNVIAPGKRTYHTLAPVLALRPDGTLFMVLGTPGSDGQTQTQLQVFNNIVHFGMSPQRAVEAPRWRSWADRVLQVEEGIGEAARQRLELLGHSLRVQRGLSAELGGAQVIMVLPSGVRSVGADPRREAYGIAW